MTKQKIDIDEARRALLMGGAVLAIGAWMPGLSLAASQSATPASTQKTSKGVRKTMSIFTTQEGVDIYYKDWGTGPVVVFSHGWPLDADSWESQMFHLASNGCRCIAHDRRGHGRSSQPWDGNDMDHYADDLAQLLDHLDVKDATVFGFSTGGGEVARWRGGEVHRSSWHQAREEGRAHFRRAAPDDQNRSQSRRFAHQSIR